MVSVRTEFPWARTVQILFRLAGEYPPAGSVVSPLVLVIVLLEVTFDTVT